MIADKYRIIKVDKYSSLPPANQLANQLTWMIADGIVQKNEKLPPIREYAKILNIHHHTIRAAYHLLEEKKLVIIRPKIGTISQDYIPFITKNHQDYFSNDLIGILVPSISDFYQQIISGIESIAFERKLIPIILNCSENPNNAEAIYKNLSARNAKGFINISVGFPDKFFNDFNEKDNLDVPLVFLDVADVVAHSITIDTFDAIFHATKHMLDHGYEDLVLVNCPSDWPVGREALKGFIKAHNICEIEFKETSIFTVPDFGFEAGSFMIDRMLNKSSIPRAIVTISDNLAMGALASLKKKGLRVPEDVAIIGFNDIFPSAIVDPPLSTVSLPMFEMGKHTMLSLIKVLNGNNKRWIRKKFTGKLIIRESCGCNVKSKGGKK
jgi:DNA-binding LacI/PurR family transcriptional regulator